MRLMRLIFTIIICPDCPSHDTIFAGVDECYQLELVLVSEFVSSTTELAFREDNEGLDRRSELMVVAVGDSCNVFTDATVNLHQPTNATI
jgi:hypothetical protein